MTKNCSYVDSRVRPAPAVWAARVGMSRMLYIVRLPPSLKLCHFNVAALRIFWISDELFEQQRQATFFLSSPPSFFCQFCMLHKKRSRSQPEALQRVKISVDSLSSAIRPYVLMYERASTFSTVNECVRVWECYIEIKMITLNRHRTDIGSIWASLTIEGNSFSNNKQSSTYMYVGMNEQGGNS